MFQSPPSSMDTYGTNPTSSHPFPSELIADLFATPLRYGRVLCYAQSLRIFCGALGLTGSDLTGPTAVPYKAIFCGDIPLHRPYIGLIYGWYLQFRFLKWPLTKSP